MKNEVKSFLELRNEGKKFSLLKANRKISEKNVTEKIGSLKSVGNLVPLIIVDAQKAIEQGYKILDIETGVEVPDSEIGNYYTILDGQHRTMAYLEILKENPDFDKPLLLYKMEIGKKKITKVLSEINNKVVVWDGGAYVKMANVETNGEYRLIKVINELTEEGYSLESANKWLTFKNEITRSVLSKLVSGEKLSEKITGRIENEKGIDRGLKILESASQSLSESVLQTRVIIDWIITKYEDTTDTEKGTFETDMCTFFESLVKKQTEAIEKAKGKRGVRTKEDIVISLLNQYFNEFIIQKQVA